MSEDGWVECCFEILAAVGLALLFEWCEENPPCVIVVAAAILGAFMVVLPFYWFIKECRQRIKGGIVLGYSLGFFAWTIAVISGFVRDLSAALGIAVFISIGMIGLAYLVIKGKMKKWGEKRRKAKIWELKDQLKELGERRRLGIVTQEEYEQKKKEMLKSIAGDKKKQKKLLEDSEA